MAKEIPLVSVIVPMYNVEKYIGECLDSILAQTLQNFELILVNNGSTDNSAAVVKNYLPRFDKRINFIEFLTNTGGASIPRNKGLQLSRGKYVFFMDSDDVLTKTALEEMHVAAENFQADVVYCENYGIFKGAGQISSEKVLIRENALVKEAAIITDDLAERLSYYLRFYFEAPPWLKFSRRDFLIEHDIDFPTTHHEDNLWTFKILCLAKKFVIAPNICYVNRKREGSETASKNDFGKQLRYELERTISGMKNLDDFMSELEFFQVHPEFRYAVLNFYTTIDLNRTTQLCASLPPHVIQEALKNVFAKELDSSGNVALISYLITNSVMLTRNLIAAQQKLSTVTSNGNSFSLGTN